MAHARHGFEELLDRAGRHKELRKDWGCHLWFRFAEVRSERRGETAPKRIQPVLAISRMPPI